LNIVNKTIYAQANAAPATGVDLAGGVYDAAKQLGNKYEQAEQKHGPNPDGTTNMDKSALADLDLAMKDQENSVAFGTFGLDRATMAAFMNDLKAAGVPTSIQLRLIKLTGEVSSEMLSTPQDVFPVVLSVFLRTKSADMTESIISIIANYESKIPGGGALDIARRAANGESVGAMLMPLRIALMAHSGDYSSKGMSASKDLERAIYSIVAPQSQFGADMLRYQTQD
jgi:hypothetical protein